MTRILALYRGQIDHLAENSERGDTRSENDHTFGQKFGFQNRTLTVQAKFGQKLPKIGQKSTLTVHFFKIFCPFKFTKKN